ncbi:MAG: ankyrin repeat domain-containing protein, partial [Fusobacteriota bacterium]
WTPLLWASARGNAEAAKVLIENGADLDMEHKISKGLPIHLAGHSGDVETSKVILEAKPEHIDAVWDLNGHGILLQASFYGHLDLAKYLVKEGADTSITTARGLGPYEMAQQFQNQKMMDIIKPYDSTDEEKAKYYEKYLERIAHDIPEDEKEIQALSDELIDVIMDGIKEAMEDESAVDKTLKKVKEIVEKEDFEVNRLGGPLYQPPLIVAVTGNNGLPTIPHVAKLRDEIAKILLEKGADPKLHEDHPMGAQTIIRAAVFNHINILRMCAEYMTPQELTDAINEIPTVNGLTALHDSVLRATMAGPDKIDGYLDQIKFFMDNGGRSDIEDFAGTTQKNIAEKCDKKEVREKLLNIL